MKFLEILEKKYGAEITHELVKDGRVYHPQEFEERRKELSEKQMQMLENANLISKSEIEAFKERGWGFDFSGWLGQFDEMKGKEIMVIGSEPHIVHPFYQIVYEFCSWGGKNDEETAKEYFERISRPTGSEVKPIWLRLANLFSNDKTDKHLLLLKVYIADLCHFAPNDMGSSKNISKEMNNGWWRIREQVARELLLEEIRVVKPKIIVAQGGDAFNMLRKLVPTDVQGHAEVETGYKRPRRYFIKFGIWDDGTKIVGLPHLGSSYNLVDNFWERKITKVVEILKAKNFL
jgi:hypothetical protein